MKAIAITIIGIMVALSGLWGGAYFAGQITGAHWAHFPIFMTSGMLSLGGVALLAIGIASIMKTQEG